MASGYEKISFVKSKLRLPMTVKMLAESLDCSERTVFRHIDVIEAENCGLRKYKSAGETFYVIQPDEKVNFNQNIVKQLEKIKKNMTANSAPEIKTVKVLDKIISLLQTTDPNEFKPEAISTDPDYVLDYGPFCDDKLQDSLVNRVLKAIHSGAAIRIHYRHSTAHSAVGEETKEVYPVKVIMRMDSLYLIAGELDEKGNQYFKN